MAQQSPTFPSGAPFAIRAYGERAVPKIQGKVYDEVVACGRRVVVAAHSQGAVLAYCALIHLASWRQEITKEVALVTFGNPVYRLHARGPRVGGAA